MENNRSLKIYPLAQADMEGIFEYISVTLCNPTAARDLINDFKKAFEKIRIFPERCQRIDNEYVKDKSLRKLIVNNYIAFYRVKDDEIQVVRVLYGMRDYQNIL